MQGNILQCYPVMLSSDVIPCNNTLWRHLPRADRAEHSSVTIKRGKEAQTFSVQYLAWARRNLQKAQRKLSLICSSTQAEKKKKKKKRLYNHVTANETM